MGRPVPQILIRFLERVEGERAMPYRDKTGVWTDGVGNTVNVHPGVTKTQAEIDADLSRNLQTAIQRLLWAVGPAVIATLNDYQYAALLSFVFNEGEKASWTIWADLRRGDLVDVPSELRKFDIAAGQPDHGLDNRRAAEIALWEGADPLCAAFPLAA